MASRHEDEEYLEQDEEEREAASRRKSLIALVLMALLVVAGIVLVQRLHEMSVVQDCLMTRAPNCNELVGGQSPQ